MLTEADLIRAANDTGFHVESLGKVERLLALLDGLRSHPFLKGRVVLKGGTALNLFVFDLPRLSVDIDLNYVGTAHRETMLAERPKVEQAIEAVCGRLGIQIKRVPSDHAGGKWRLSYTIVTGRPGSLEVDVNFILRTPLWGNALSASRPVGPFSVGDVPVLDPHELAAGKLAALFGRTASRDLFDSREMLAKGALERGRLRLHRRWRAICQGALRPRRPRRHGCMGVRSSRIAAVGDPIPADCRSRIGWWITDQRARALHRDRRMTVTRIEPEYISSRSIFLEILRERS